MSKAFEQVGIEIGTNATWDWEEIYWEYSGEITKYKEHRLCVLYRQENGRMQDTGIYLGNGEYIYASKDGVVKEKMPGNWTHWGIPIKLFKYFIMVIYIFQKYKYLLIIDIKIKLGIYDYYFFLFFNE